MVKARHWVESLILLLLAIAAITFELIQVDEIDGRDVFRILWPAILVMLALLVLDLLAVVERLARDVSTIERFLRPIAKTDLAEGALDDLQDLAGPVVVERK